MGVPMLALPEPEGEVGAASLSGRTLALVSASASAPAPASSAHLQRAEPLLAGQFAVAEVGRVGAEVFETEFLLVARHDGESVDSIGHGSDPLHVHVARRVTADSWQEGMDPTILQNIAWAEARPEIKSRAPAREG